MELVLLAKKFFALFSQADIVSLASR